MNSGGFHESQPAKNVILFRIAMHSAEKLKNHSEAFINIDGMRDRTEREVQ